MVPKVRFKGFTDEWEQRKLGGIANRILRKNKNNISSLPLTISAQSGLIAQNNFFDKQVASQNLSNYLLLYKGDFAYNKSYSNGYPYGAVKRLEKFNCGVVSSLYIAFKPTHVLPNFLAEYYETTKWYVEIYKRAAEGVRNHGLLNISATDFFNSDISLPKRRDEQEKIGQLFQSLDKTITLHEEKHRQLERLKKALLQKMFADETGYPVLRFKCFTEKWEQVELNDIAPVTMGQSPNSKNYTENPNNYILVQGNADLFNGQVLPRIYTTQVTKVAHAGDILMSVRAPVGNIAQTQYDVVIGRGIAAISGNLFIKQLLNKMDKAGYWNKYIAGSTFESVNSNDIKSANIKVPKLEEQEKISQLFQSLDKTITLHDKKIQYLKQLKRGLLQKMFV